MIARIRQRHLSPEGSRRLLRHLQHRGQLRLSLGAVDHRHRVQRPLVPASLSRRRTIAWVCCNGSGGDDRLQRPLHQPSVPMREVHPEETLCQGSSSFIALAHALSGYHSGSNSGGRRSKSAFPSTLVLSLAATSAFSHPLPATASSDEHPQLPVPTAAQRRAVHADAEPTPPVPDSQPSSPFAWEAACRMSCRFPL